MAILVANREILQLNRFFGLGESMQQNEQYRCIWLAGNHDALIAGIREQLRKIHGAEAAADPARFMWNNAEFAIRSSPEFGLVIAIPVKSSEDANSWNQKLQNFYDQVVQPVADKTGGVTVGLAEPGALNV